MTTNRSTEYLISLVHELRKLPVETEWVEFKHNNDNPKEIGEYLSALANAAALYGKSSAYLVWGIDDATYDVIGTSFTPATKKVGNEELENWLLRLLEPKIHFRFFTVDVDGHSVVLLEIGRAFRHPVRFQGQEFIRVGSYKKKLKDFGEKERELWRIFDQIPFEDMIAAENVSSDDVLKWLDYPNYFRLMDEPLPDNRIAILERLAADNVIAASQAGKFNITNIGAALFAHRLSYFDRLKRKALRVVVYRGDNRFETIKEELFDRGYAIAYEDAVRYINDQLPQSEEIAQALRRTVQTYPEIAIRELVANAMIHQDFTIRGAAAPVRPSRFSTCGSKSRTPAHR